MLQEMEGNECISREWEDKIYRIRVEHKQLMQKLREKMKANYDFLTNEINGESYNDDVSIGCNICWSLA